MKNVILVTIMMLVLSSVSSAVLLPTISITTIRYYTDALHNTTSDYFVETYNDAIVGVGGGEGDILLLSMYDDSTVNVYDGEVEHVWMDDNSNLNLFGGNIGVVSVSGTSDLTIFGYNFTYHIPSQGSPLWEIRGNWGNNIPFEIMFRGTDPTTSQITLYTVPEPATVTFLGFGLVCLVNKRKMKS